MKHYILDRLGARCICSLWLIVHTVIDVSHFENSCMHCGLDDVLLAFYVVVLHLYLLHSGYYTKYDIFFAWQIIVLANMLLIQQIILCAVSLLFAKAPKFVL